MSSFDPSRPPILPPKKPHPAGPTASGSTSTSPRQSGPPSRLEVSPGLSSGETSPSSSDDDEVVVVESGAPKASGSMGATTPKGISPGKAQPQPKPARELTPPTDTQDEPIALTTQVSATPIKLTSRITNLTEEVKKDVKYCHQ